MSPKQPVESVQSIQPAKSTKGVAISSQLSVIGDKFRDRLGSFRPRDVDGLQLFEIAEPGPLAFGELVGVGLELFDGFGERETVFEVGQNFAVAESLSGGGA